jgi:microcystin-dependent protein
MADEYVARKASTLPTIATVDPADKIMVINEGAPPDVVLAPMDALAALAGSYAPPGPNGEPGPPGAAGPPGTDLRVDGVVADEAALPTTGVVTGDTYVTADTGQLWVYDSTATPEWTLIATAIGPKGEPGDVGQPGPPGERGPQGLQGPTGIGIAGANVPVGTVLDFVGTAAPAGFLMCNGAEYAQATYPQLAAILVGSNWAQAATVGYFRVPNLNGRTTVGIDPADATFGVVGKLAGDKNAVVVDHSHPAGALNMQSHVHGVNIWSQFYNVDHFHGMQHTHPGVGFGNANGAIFRGAAWNGGGWDLSFVQTNVPTGSYINPPTGPADRNTTDAADRDVNHRHAINGTSDPAGGVVTGNTANTGVAGTNRNLPPYAVLSKIIRAAV